ncbi:SUMF1/EgtB/PvdO family nonheme iron enzyme [Myxococcota bacterium]|nr:SUMF1/EgtB/PvdO family nonheme iron enzyme [Myxococcota bacterium]MBU1411793.1 SUMF1/EgtB/PvdO family nonheme iron enzyme [Myxococcota bacterium]MBU1512066.1 SUMF1/EgtB/PvdO family nonheme iron enzyme [Myxococcota bacterium]
MKKRTILLALLATCLMLWSCDDTTKKTEGCGNGLLDLGEECDGEAGEATTCAELGYYEQFDPVLCGTDCRRDLSVCAGRCGDIMIQVQYGEDCEGENLGGDSCVSLGYERGTLACDASCHFDRTGCEGAGSCGDGVIQNPEDCDGNELGGETCAGLGYYSGTLACGSNCRFSLTSCDHRCGDGMVDMDYQEVCDGLNLDGQTCVGLGYHGGALACAGDCRGFDETDCAAVGRCGDDEVQTAHGEACDGSDLDGESCASRGYSQGSGALGCTTGCLFDEGLCVPESTNADLATLTVSAGTLTPAFSAGEITYTVTVPNVQETLTVAATTADPWATVVIAPVQPMALAEGANPVAVTVTAEDGTQKTYAVTVTRSRNYESPNIGTLIYVPAGTFQRDATVTNLSVVSAFHMSQYEITRAQWTAVTGWTDPSNVTYSSGTSDPVQMVSWYDAIAFCNKLSLLEGLTPVYSVSGVDFSTLTYAQIPASDNATWNAATANWAASGYRLPTEMEWMWAAMGADTANPGAVNTTGFAKAFAGSTGSNLIGDYAWYGLNSASKTHPAGTKLPNELGLYDLSGNVWEWAWDWYTSSYPTGTQTNYRGTASGINRVRRGAGWEVNASFCPVANRNYYYPYGRDYVIGFRVARP